MHFRAAADKNGREYRYSDPLTVDLLLVNQRTMRLQRQPFSNVFDDIRCRRAVAHPACIGRVELLAPQAAGNTFESFDGMIVEIEDCKYFVRAIPASNKKNAVTFEAHHIHLVFT